MSDQLWEDGVSIYRPSYSATWLGCAGSLRPSMKAADSSGYDAAVGTVFHQLIAEWQTKQRPDYLAGQIIKVEKKNEYGELMDTFLVDVDEDMFIYGQECLDYVKDIPGKRYIETWVDISGITPIKKQGGTADFAACSPGVLDITDWKYGRGVQVFAYKNTQLLCYAYGFFCEYDWLYDFQTIRMRIAQPRLNHWDVWEISREELLEWADEARGKAYRAWKRNADRTPSPKACQWCKVSVGCPAFEAQRQALVDELFDDVEVTYSESEMKQIVATGSPPPREIPDPLALPTAQLARILTYRKLMDNWFNRCAEVLIERGLHGEDLDGRWKVVEGRTKRKYRDEDEAVERLFSLGLSEDDIFVKKVISPNQLKKKLSAIGIRGKLQADYIKTLVYLPKGRLTLAPDGDTRIAYDNPVDLLDDLDEEEPT